MYRKSEDNSDERNCMYDVPKTLRFTEQLEFTRDDFESVVATQFHNLNRYTSDIQFETPSL